MRIDLALLYVCLCYVCFIYVSPFVFFSYFPSSALFPLMASFLLFQLSFLCVHGGVPRGSVTRRVRVPKKVQQKSPNGPLLVPLLVRHYAEMAVCFQACSLSGMGGWHQVKSWPGCWGQWEAQRELVALGWSKLKGRTSAHSLQEQAR